MNQRDINIILNAPSIVMSKKELLGELSLRPLVFQDKMQDVREKFSIVHKQLEGIRRRCSYPSNSAFCMSMMHISNECNAAYEDIDNISHVRDYIQYLQQDAEETHENDNAELSYIASDMIALDKTIADMIDKVINRLFNACVRINEITSALID